jgi:deazaflavin-dependent oxidoreductase (nitroreductase family)
MTLPADKPIPAPNMRDWQHVHLARYLATDGEDGYWWQSPRAGVPGPVPTLILTTTGRRSGTQYLNPLIFGEHEGRCVIVASRGGAAAHPSWYLNLAAVPEVGVQVKGRKFSARARTASGQGRATLWALMVKVYPSYAEYQKSTEREIPVVVLDPV